MKVPLRRYGGKVYLAKWIISHFPEHTTYVEPFCGSGAVFFQKEPAQAEFLNDSDERLINAFEQIRSRPFELAAMIWATPYAQKNWRKENSESLLEKAALDIAATQQFYAGATTTSTFRIDPGHENKNAARVWADWFQRILPAAVRLKDAQILCRDAFEIIERFSLLEDVLFYVDPPYLGHENEYPDSVCFERLAGVLGKVKGKVVLSGTVAEEKHFSAGWRQIKRDYVSRAPTGKHSRKAKTYEECLYLNFEGTNEP